MNSSTALTQGDTPATIRARGARVFDLKGDDPAHLDVTVGGPAKREPDDDPLKDREEDGSN